MYKIGIDAMGGDFAPEVPCKAVEEALKLYPDLEFVLYGDQDKIKEHIDLNNSRVSVVHTTKYLDMGEHDPFTVMRHNKDLSMALAMTAGKNKEVDGIVTAGPTQAVIIGSHLFLRRMQGVKRIALCPIIPSAQEGKKKVYLDSGANVELKAEHLVDFAFIGSVVAKALKISDKPKVGYLNIGTEPGKGRELDQEVYDLLMKDERINFVGFVETKEILSSDCDVLVIEGFVGNMVMKTLEGTAQTTGRILKEEIKKSFWAKLGYVLFMKKTFKRYAKRLNPNSVGGAMVVGVNSPIVKAHGAANVEAYVSCIRQCRDLAQGNLIEEIAKNLNKEEN